MGRNAGGRYAGEAGELLPDSFDGGQVIFSGAIGVISTTQLFQMQHRLAKAHANRIIPKAPTIGSQPDRHSGAARQGPQDAPTGSQLPHPIEEEWEALALEGEGQAAQEADPDNQTGDSGMDREGHSTFRITVALKVSNYGRRDPTGALETICDLITATRRRLSERFASRQLVGGNGGTRKRGSNNHHRKIVDKLPLPF